jgi:hypothetical protein
MLVLNDILCQVSLTSEDVTQWISTYMTTGVADSLYTYARRDVRMGVRAFKAQHGNDMTDKCH